MRSLPFHKQLDSSDCGPSCLRMIAAAYGKRYSIAHLREKSYINKEGVSIKGICEAAESIGMKSLVAKLPLMVEKEKTILPYPVLLYPV